jgi:hypothetical protein
LAEQAIPGDHQSDQPGTDGTAENAASGREGQSASPLSAGSGGCSNRGEDGLCRIEAAKLVERAVREKWAKGPWPLHLKPSELEAERQIQGEWTIQQYVADAVLRGVQSGNLKAEQIAARTGVTMHGQNLSADQHRDRMDYHERALEQRTGSSHGTGNVNFNVGEDCAGRVQIYLPHNFRDPPPPDAIIGGPGVFGASPGLVIDATEKQDDLEQP